MNIEIHQERAEAPKPKYTPSLEEVRKLAEPGITIPIYKTLSAAFETPASAYLKLTQEHENVAWSPSCLLESVEGGIRLGRYSMIIPTPKRVIEVSSKGGWTETEGNKSISYQEDVLADPLEIIASYLPKKVVKVSGLPPFHSGVVGYLGYENINRWETTVPVHEDTMGIPDAVLLQINNLVVFDHVLRQMKVVGHIVVEDPSNIDRDYQIAVEHIEEITRQLKNPLDPRRYTRYEKLARYESGSNFTPGEYKETIERARQKIIEGDIMQVVLSQKFKRRTDASPFEIYRKLWEANPSPFLFYMDFGKFQLVGASPELLVRVEDGEVTTWPIAGTRPRGKTPEEDQILAEELIKDEKERAEHVMLVDLGRNDIGRVSEIGTVRVARFMEIEFFSTVMHITSEVRGKLREGLTSLDAIRSCFPAGTVSGAPKIRAMQLIHEFEPERRGPYAGAVGIISDFNNAELAITIRTVVVKDGVVYNQAGGGIVYDSKPDSEYEETCNKALGGQRAVNLAEEPED